MSFASWANRRSGRAPQQEERESPRQSSRPPAQPQQVTLPPAPAGMAWSFQAGQFVLIPLGHPQVVREAAIVAPVRQPAGVVPYQRQQVMAGLPAGSPARMVETCQLVKPGDRDTYAELLASTPDLVPDPGFDVEAGNPNPLVVQELRGCSEYHPTVDAPQPNAPLRSFTGGAPLVRGSAPLKGA